MDLQQHAAFDYLCGLRSHHILSIFMECKHKSCTTNILAIMGYYDGAII